MTSQFSSDIIQQDKLVEFTYCIRDKNGQVLEQIDLPVSYVHGGEFGLWQQIEAVLTSYL